MRRGQHDCIMVMTDNCIIQCYLAILVTSLRSYNYKNHDLGYTDYSIGIAYRNRSQKCGARFIRENSA